MCYCTVVFPSYPDWPWGRPVAVPDATSVRSLPVDCECGQCTKYITLSRPKGALSKILDECLHTKHEDSIPPKTTDIPEQKNPRPVPPMMHKSTRCTEHQTERFPDNVTPLSFHDRITACPPHLHARISHPVPGTTAYLNTWPFPGTGGRHWQ